MRCSICGQLDAYYTYTFQNKRIGICHPCISNPINLNKIYSFLLKNPGNDKEYYTIERKLSYLDNAPESLILKVLDREEDKKHYLKRITDRKEKFSPEFYKKIDKIFIHLFTCRNDIPLNIQSLIAESNRTSSKKELAQNPTTSPEILAKLADDDYTG